MKRAKRAYRFHRQVSASERPAHLPSKRQGATCPSAKQASGSDLPSCQVNAAIDRVYPPSERRLLVAYPKEP